MEKNKMLIDATHPEETRVVAMRNGRVEEFDFESAARKLLRGNIYLAKVTRVEPSLQAAFIDYGGNRHGFLAFNEIHPDYYQIPVADREALKQEEAEAELRAEAEADERARSRGPRRRRKRGERNGNGNGGQGQPTEARDEFAPAEVETFEDGYSTSTGYGPIDEGQGHETAAALRHDVDPDDVRRAPSAEGEPTRPDPVPTAAMAPPFEAPYEVRAERAPEAGPGEAAFEHRGPERHEAGEPEQTARAPAGTADWHAPESETRDRLPAERDDDADHGEDAAEANGHGAADEDVEQIATDEDALEEVPERPRRRTRQYKIQEVIKRRQIMLVQVVKEERGNKGAALTTYISLAGRYTVLMPNTARGGGISRKITQPQDRKRLKAIAEELDVPEGMGLIIRTAGAARTKQEIKRDYEYLLRLWESVRDLTLSSTAPAVVYEEGNIIKRAIRDLYSKEFDQIVVAGDAAHREAQDFMEMLMPGSGGHVASYRGAEPLFARYGIERQLNALFSPYVTLRSGGYIVINQTEALVSVDVNSGKSTREFSIEETALNTNLEAAEEIARQLKLRDLAGLIVVDFIDMEEKRNNRAVERRLKDALRHDRARIQVGHISHFGLLEMSRQRLRAGVLEGSTSQCPHCQGTGIIRSIESVALGVLRATEDHLTKQVSSLVVNTTAEVALYILNHKRAFIVEMEGRYGVVVRVEASDRMQGANFAIERIAAPVQPAKPAARAAVSMEWGFDRDAEPDEEADEPADTAAALDDERSDDGDGRGPERESAEEGRGRKRRRRRGRRDRDGQPREARPAGSAPMHGDGDDEGLARDERQPAALEPLGAEPGGRVAGADDGDDDAEGQSAATAEPGDRPGEGEAGRRGRRRGRRGGRSRRRDADGGMAPGLAGGLDDADRHEWGVAEMARPGAEQPGAGDAPGEPMGLVGSVEPADYHRGLVPSPRTAIVETIGRGGARDAEAPSFAGAADEAQRLATRLASAAAAAMQPVRQPAAAGELPPPVPPVPAIARPRAAPRMPEAQPEAQPQPVTELPGLPEPAEPAEPAEPVARQPYAAEPAGMERIPRDNANVHGNGGHALAGSAGSAAAAAERTAIADEELARPSRRGWWQRRFGGGE